MMQLIISNKQVEAKIGNLRAILSNLITDEKSRDEAIPLLAISVNFITLLRLAKSSCQTIKQKKIAFTQAKVTRLNS